MSDGRDECFESDEGSSGLSSTQLQQLETRVVERLLARLAPGSQRPKPKVSWGPYVARGCRGVRGTGAPGQLEPAIGNTAGMVDVQ